MSWERMSRVRSQPGTPTKWIGRWMNTRGCHEHDRDVQGDIATSRDKWAGGVNCGERLVHQYRQTWFLSGSTQIGQWADKWKRSTRRRCRGCSCRKTKDVRMQMGDAVQYDHPMHLFIDTFSQDQSCVK